MGHDTGNLAERLFASVVVAVVVVVESFVVLWGCFLFVCVLYRSAF